MSEMEPGLVAPPSRDVVDYLEAPLRRPLHFLVPFLAVAMGAAVVFTLAPERYRATTVIVADWGPAPDRAGRNSPKVMPRRRLQTLVEDALSYPHLERVIDEVTPYPDLANKAPMEQLVGMMRADVRFDAQGTDSLKIAYVHGDPDKAVLVVNRLASLVVEDIPREREERAKVATEVIESQLEGVRQELKARAMAVRLYKERHLGALPDQAASLAALQRIQMEEQALTQKLKTAEEQLAAQEGALSEPSHAPEGAGNAERSPLAEINRLRAQLSTLRARYTDEHPDVKTLLNRISSLETGLAAGGNADPNAAAGSGSASQRARLALARREVAVLQAKKDALDRRLASFQARLEQVPRTEQELADLTRDSDKLNEKYAALFSRKMDAAAAAKLEEDGPEAEFRIVDQAKRPEKPFFPDPLLFLWGGLAGGLLAGLVVAVAAEALDDTVANVRDLEALMAGDVLAVLPHVGARQAREPGAKARVPGHSR